MLVQNRTTKLLPIALAAFLVITASQNESPATLTPSSGTQTVRLAL